MKHYLIKYHWRISNALIKKFFLLLCGTFLFYPLASYSFTFTKIADTNTPIPVGTGNFVDFTNFSAAFDGTNVAFSGKGSIDAGIYKTNGGFLQLVVNQDTLIPNGTGSFGTGIFFSSSSMSGGFISFRGFDPGTNEFGIYSDIGGTVSLVADINTPIPGSPGTFGRTGLGCRNIVFKL